MSDPNDVWQNSAPAPTNGDGDRDMSPRRDRDRSRSPARNGGGGDRGRAEGGGGGGGDPVNQGNNLHVSGLARSVDVALLEEVFGKVGKVFKAEIMQDPHTQESRGFGFVKMESAEDAEACISQLNQTTLEGKTLTVAHARRGRARTPTPGRYHGVKLEDRRPYNGGGGGGYYGGGDRPYQPRSYDSRYSDRGPPRYDDRRYDDRDYRPRYDDRRYDDRRDDRRYDDRRYDDRRDDRYERRDDRPRYDERPRY